MAHLNGLLGVAATYKSTSSWIQKADTFVFPYEFPFPKWLLAIWNHKIEHGTLTQSQNSYTIRNRLQVSISCGDHITRIQDSLNIND